MGRNLSIPEVLTLVHNAPSNEKSRILKQNETPALLHILRHAFCDGLQFDSGVPEYVQSNRPLGTDLASLHAEARRLYIFTTDYNKISIPRKRELLQTILVSIHASEAKLLTAVIKKELNINGLDAALVEQTFPGLLAYKGQKWMPVTAESDVIKKIIAKVEPEPEAVTVKVTKAPRKPRKTKVLKEIA
jgi:hypothetical protein